MTMDQLLSFTQEVGFPIVVTLYLLHRIEGKLEKLNNTIMSLPVRMKASEYPERKKETV
jgi:hypothetical protein